MRPCPMLTRHTACEEDTQLVDSNAVIPKRHRPVVSKNPRPAPTMDTDASGTVFELLGGLLERDGRSHDKDSVSEEASRPTVNIARWEEWLLALGLQRALVSVIQEVDSHVVYWIAAFGVNIRISDSRVNSR